MKKQECCLLQEARSVYQFSRAPLTQIRIASLGTLDLEEYEQLESQTSNNRGKILNVKKRSSSMNNSSTISNSTDIPPERAQIKFSSVMYSSQFLKDEKLARTIFYHIVIEMEKLHAKNIYNLRITPDKLFFTQDYKLKFDASSSQKQEFEKNSTEEEKNYLAPEAEAGLNSITTFSDIYSLGLLLFVFKTGTLPFIKNKPETFSLANLLHEDPETFWIIYSNLNLNLYAFSPEFKELFTGMVRKDPKKRLTLTEVKRSKWLQLPIYSDEELKTLVEEIIF
jgi:Serine/threonine protein kinase